jgi:CubicO group peptidase (beta-lactamase class C family)
MLTIFKVERLGGYGSLEDYMSKNIWGPLGMTAVTFRLDDHEDICSHLVEMLARDEHRCLVPAQFSISPHTFKYDAGGDGIYIKPSDYTKLLASLLRNDEIVLKKETVDLLFIPQLPDPKWLKAAVKTTPYPMDYTMLHALPKEKEWNWGLGGLLNMEDIPGKRKKGTLCWSGFPNLFWVGVTVKLVRGD